MLDFFVVCHRVLNYVEDLTIDEEGKYELTNFSSKQTTGVVKPSDHMTLVLDLKLSYSKKCKNRVEMYNLKKN